MRYVITENQQEKVVQSMIDSSFKVRMNYINDTWDDMDEYEKDDHFNYHKSLNDIAKLKVQEIQYDNKEYTIYLDVYMKDGWNSFESDNDDLFDALGDDLSKFLGDEVFIATNQTIDYKEDITEMIKESQSNVLIDKYLTSQLGDYKLSDWFHNEEEYTNKHGDVIIFLDRVHEGYTEIAISEDIYDSFGSLFSLDNDEIQIHLLKWFKDHMEINNAEEIEVFSI
jgi:hypothetical protein